MGEFAECSYEDFEKDEADAEADEDEDDHYSGMEGSNEHLSQDEFNKGEGSEKPRENKECSDTY